MNEVVNNEEQSSQRRQGGARSRPSGRDDMRKKRMAQKRAILKRSIRTFKPFTGRARDLKESEQELGLNDASENAETLVVRC